MGTSVKDIFLSWEEGCKSLAELFEDRVVAPEAFLSKLRKLIEQNIFKANTRNSPVEALKDAFDWNRSSRRNADFEHKLDEFIERLRNTEGFEQMNVFSKWETAKTLLEGEESELGNIQIGKTWPTIMKDEGTLYADGQSLRY